MPLLRYRCAACGEAARRFVDTRQKGATTGPCLKCGGALVRNATGPSAQVVERLDNGAMPKALERLADAERLHAERVASADPAAGRGDRPDRDQ